MIKNEFLRQVKTEIVKVKWPRREELIKLSSLVVVASIVMAAVIGLLDILFLKLFNFLVINSFQK